MRATRGTRVQALVGLFALAFLAACSHHGSILVMHPTEGLPYPAYPLYPSPPARGSGIFGAVLGTGNEHCIESCRSPDTLTATVEASREGSRASVSRTMASYRRGFVLPLRPGRYLIAVRVPGASCPSGPVSVFAGTYTRLEVHCQGGGSG